MELPESTVKSRWKKCFLRSDVSWPTYLLICLFGLGSWIAVNGLWVELPVLVKRAPEKWNLPSYLTVIIQLANVGPLMYSIGNRFASTTVHEKTAIPFVVSLGALACALLGFFWDKTSYIGGVEHSTVLLILCFCVAIVDCTSSVVFLTFMSIFPSQYMTALFIGETCSGLLPAFVALGQGIDSGNNCHSNSSNATAEIPSKSGLKFGPEEFFFFLCAMMVICGLAFWALNCLPVARKQHVRLNVRTPSQESIDDATQHLIFTSPRNYSESAGTTSEDGCTRQHIIYLLLIQAWINCLNNGALPSIQAYASEPYGEETYHLVATLSSIASALTCFMALWLPSRSSVLVTIFACVYTILSGYVLVLASMSPTPPLYNTTLGSFLIITVSIVSGMIISYTKLTICTMMRDRGRRALFWCGISIQAGSCVGALVMFPLVNIFKLFHQAKTC